MVLIGSRILEYRKKLNMSQEEFANKIGVSRQAVSKWELDKAYPDLDKLVDICEMFGLSLDELVNGVEQDEKSVIGDEENAELAARQQLTARRETTTRQRLTTRQGPTISRQPTASLRRTTTR